MKQILIFTFFAFSAKAVLAIPVYPSISNQLENSILPVFELIREGNEFAAFKYNALGNISEYYLIQGSNWDISEATIVQAEYTEGTEIRLSGSNGLVYVFSIIENGASSLGNLRIDHAFGIAHYSILNSTGISLGDARGVAFGGGGSTEPGGCDNHCLSGGCGATSCSRTVWELSCEVSCDSDRFACCGDLVSYGCHCELKSCCGSKK